ncbi:helix-turn-helix transcriptional regulator [Bradyrhizobium japonicum]|uniref:helix-turn-helix transcriptional regulator n=1 Tax=Bradyrhizobium japonicum TaxID=375 RepID=UPI0009B72BBB|nr:helix-turn-helix domain-containing protein [Bradyrhizobium japonicum]
MTFKDQSGAGASPPDTWLTRKQAAAYLKLGESTLAKLFVSGDGPPAIKIGRSVRYLALDLNVWMNSRRRASTSDTAAA